MYGGRQDNYNSLPMQYDGIHAMIVQSIYDSK